MSFAWWLFALYLAKGADVGFTELAIAGGWLEQNPVLTDRWVRVSAAAAAPLGVEYSARWLERDGHPRLAVVLRVATVALWCYGSFHNARLGRARAP